MNGWMVWMNGWMVWMNGWMDGWTDGMDGWTGINNSDYDIMNGIYYNPLEYIIQ
jgi:hypothetical protein